MFKDWDKKTFSIASTSATGTLIDITGSGYLIATQGAPYRGDVSATFTIDGTEVLSTKLADYDATDSGLAGNGILLLQRFETSLKVDVTVVEGLTAYHGVSVAYALD